MIQFLSQVFLLLAIYSRVSGGNQSDLAVTRAFYFMAILLLRLCLEKSVIVLNSLNGFSKPPIPSKVVYRSTSPPVFLDEFSIYLENVIMCPEPLIIAGDFNFHLDLVHSNNSRRFEELLETFGLSLWACPGSCHHPIH